MIYHLLEYLKFIPYSYQLSNLEGQQTQIKRTQGHVAIVITVYNHYVNIAVLSHIPLIAMGQ